MSNILFLSFSQTYYNLKIKYEFYFKSKSKKVEQYISKKTQTHYRFWVAGDVNP